MSYFNDVMKTYITHYSTTLGYTDILPTIEAEKIPDRDVAIRLVEFSDKMFAQGTVDEENGLVLGRIDVDVYDIEKTCVTISSFVDAQGYGDLLNLN